MAKLVGSEKKSGVAHFIVTSIICALGFALACEIILFNWGFWTTRDNQAIGLELEHGSGLEKSGDAYVVVSTDEAYLEASNIGVHVGNLFFDLASCDGPTFDFTTSVTDQAHASYMSMPASSVALSVPNSRYLELHTAAGETNSIRITINEEVGSSFELRGISANASVPFELSGLRVVLAFAVLSLVFSLRPSSPLYTHNLSWSVNAHRAFIIVLTIIEIGCFLRFCYRGFGTQDTWEAHDQYDDLANAFIVGSVSLDKEVPDFLKDLSNPYDPSERGQYLASVGEQELADSYTDYAYYDNAFYSYFGPLPALVLFVPFKLIFGRDMPTWISVFFFGSIFMVTAKVLVYQMAKRLLKVRMSIGLFLLIDIMLCSSSGLIYLGWLPVVYSVPIIASLALTAMGLSFWLLSKHNPHALNKTMLAAGSLCIAATLGCRQTFVLSFLLAFPIFWKEITEQRVFFSRRGLANTLCVILPFVFCGCAVMAYNWVRFDSPFDFGAAYNLTSNDMTKRGIELARFPLGIFAYLFQPIAMDSAFPYMTTVNVLGDYQGYTSAEPMFGGFFSFSAIALLGLAFFSRKFVCTGQIRGLALTFLGLGVALMLIDIQVSGITARYMSDFSFFLLIPAVMVMLLVADHRLSSRGKWLFNAVCVTGVMGSLALNVWALLIDGRYGALRDAFPALYYGMKQALSFLW